jgi:hypothetical protein
MAEAPATRRSPQPTATRVFPATLNASDLTTLSRLLASDGGCEDACYLGITPGKTTWADTRAILQPLVGELGPPAYYSEGVPVYTVDLSVPRDGSMSYGLHHHVSFSVFGETIRRLEVFVSDEGYGNLDQTDFFSLWASYSPREVFSRYGRPDQVLFHTNEAVNLPGYLLLLLYHDLGFAIEFSGLTGENYTICPQMRDTGDVLGLRISLVDPGTALELVSPNWVPASSAFWEHIETKLGLDIGAFYDRIMSMEPPCFPLQPSPQ